MKVKLNLDKETLRAFFLQHTEKLVFGGVILCFVFMVYRALGRETYDQTPEALIGAAQTAEEWWKRTPPASDLKVTDYDKMVAWWRDHPIEVAPYEHPTPWDDRIFASLGPRREPAVLAVEKLRGSTSMGAFEFKAAAAVAVAGRVQQPGGTVQGRRWVVLTGLVPYARQQAALRECLKDAEFQDLGKDKLDYLGYFVERAEVTGSDANSPLNFSQKFLFHEKARAAVMENWARPATEIVDAKFVEDNLAFPLGPLADRSWGASAAHPDIPMKNAPDGPAPSAAPEAQPTESAPEDPFAVRRTPANVDRSRSPSRQEEKVEAYRLFRFFDFTAEPGKKYVYRVQLVIRNPNYQVESRYLSKPELANDSWLATKIEDAATTGIISVPRDNRLFALSVTPPLRLADSPSGKVAVQQFVMENGRMSSKEFAVVRGKVVNFYGESAAVKIPKGRRDDGDEAFLSRKEPDPVSVDYVTDALVLDMRGGAALSGRGGLSAPGEMLILDPDGNLLVHNELDDQAAYGDMAATKSEAGLGRTLDALPPAGNSGGFGEMYR